jgi:hypothetical protein
MNKLYCSLTLSAGFAAALAGCNAAGTMTEPETTAPLFTQASSAPLPAGSTTTLSVNGCDFTVTYTWNGFKGRRLIATFGLYERLSSLDASFDLDNVEGQLGKSGSVSHIFNLTANAHAARTIVARGELVDSRKFTQISGSSSASSNTIVSTCG